jgi:hypothetical protein
MRFAVLGLYNSGSSVLAGVLHRLGANLGPPFWGHRPGRPSTLWYEADDLARELRRWWAEPLLAEQVTAAERTSFLAAWIARQEAGSPAPCGAKHPLLSLCGTDLRAAWGPATRFLWSRRPLADSIAGLARRGWFPDREIAIQQQLWDGIEALIAGGAEVVAMDWATVRRDPAATAHELAELVGLAPSVEQLAAAAAWVRT